jgi:hypothetical protein
MSAQWKPLTRGIYFNVGQRTVCELVDDSEPLTYHDILEDVRYLTSTISIVHYRKNSDYADSQAMDAAARVDRWLKKIREQQEELEK